MSDEQQEMPASGGKMSTKMIVTIIGVLVLVIVTGSAASRFFGKSAAEQAIEAATGGKANIDASKGEVTVKTDDGTWSSSDKLPANFPSDVPLYPGAKVQGSVVAAQQQGSGHYAGLETVDTIDKVVSWYKAEVVAKGWQVTANFEAGGGVMIGGSKDTRDLVVTVSKEGDKTVIGLVVSQK